MTQNYQHSVRVHSYRQTDIVRAEIYETAKAIWNEGNIFDVQDQADLDNGIRAQTRAKQLLSAFPKDQLKWLKRQKAQYRISATFTEKRATAADLSLPMFEPEAEMVAMDYDIEVWFEDGSTAMLFKLTWGGH